MKLKVRCVSNDLPTLELLFECGEGQQTFKWLGLAVAQRYSFLKIPQGRYRFVPLLVLSPMVWRQRSDNDTLY